MKKKTILVVDDDLDLLEQLTTILENAGYQVVSADSHAAAEEAILKTKADLAILDLMMEEKDSGFILSYQIKKLYPDTPVIMLTAVTGATGVSFATQLPEAQSWTKVDKILDKPVRPEQLKAEVRRMLQEEPENGSSHS
ncbi:MAG: response regulator [Acidobacteria bacterium]|nr:response regulator [Acidobacteriota bacterium]